MSGIKKMEINALAPDGNYTTDEIDKAKKAAAEVIKKIKQFGYAFFYAIQSMYEFQQSRQYLALSWNNMDDWLQSEGYAPSTYRKYLAIYKSFTIRLGIEVDAYNRLDIGKIVSLKVLADAGASADEIRDSIVEVDELPMPDLIESTNEKKRQLDAGKGIEEKPDTVKSVIDDLKPGAYKIIKLGSADHADDPRFNKEKMVVVPKVKTKWFFNIETKEFTAVIQ